ncbi:MAG: hypothetical protein ACI8TQ_001598, partial [Planctomycetota bacterium]
LFMNREAKRLELVPAGTLQILAPADDRVRSSRTPVSAKCQQEPIDRQCRSFMVFGPRVHE